MASRMASTVTVPGPYLHIDCLSFLTPEILLIAREVELAAIASHEIAFAYGADCPVPRVKDLARPW